MRDRTPLSDPPLLLAAPPRPAPLVALALAVVAVSGCASTGGGGSVAYRAELGRAPNAQTLAGISAEVLQLYSYELELVNADLVQTSWRYLPYGVRDRATVQVRSRGSDLYNGSIRIVVEERKGGGSWQTTPPPADLRDQYAALQKDVRTRLQRVMTQN